MIFHSFLYVYQRVNLIQLRKLWHRSTSSAASTSLDPGRGHRDLRDLRDQWQIRETIQVLTVMRLSDGPY